MDKMTDSYTSVHILNRRDSMIYSRWRVAECISVVD